MLAELERRRLRALVDADLAAADELHAPEFELVTPGGDTYTKDEYLGSIRSGEVNYLRWDADDEIVERVQGDAGCVRYSSTIEIEVGGSRLPAGRYRHTDYYERRDGRWQVVFSQATALPGP